MLRERNWSCRSADSPVCAAKGRFRPAAGRFSRSAAVFDLQKPRRARSAAVCDLQKRRLAPSEAVFARRTPIFVRCAGLLPRRRSPGGRGRATVAGSRGPAAGCRGPVGRSRGPSDRLQGRPNGLRVPDARRRGHEHDRRFVLGRCPTAFLLAPWPFSRRGWRFPRGDRPSPPARSPF